MIQQLNNSNFQSTIDNNKVVLVDFYADWCGPSQALHPTLESLAKEFDGRAVISKINVDNNRALSSQFGVRSIPSIFYFTNGELVGKKVGPQSKSVILDNINTLLKISTLFGSSKAFLLYLQTRLFVNISPVLISFMVWISGM